MGQIGKCLPPNRKVGFALLRVALPYDRMTALLQKLLCDIQNFIRDGVQSVLKIVKTAFRMFPEGSLPSEQQFYLNS